MKMIIRQAIPPPHISNAKGQRRPTRSMVKAAMRHPGISTAPEMKRLRYGEPMRSDTPRDRP